MQGFGQLESFNDSCDLSHPYTTAYIQAVLDIKLSLRHTPMSSYHFCPKDCGCNLCCFPSQDNAPAVEADVEQVRLSLQRKASGSAPAALLYTEEEDRRLEAFLDDGATSTENSDTSGPSTQSGNGEVTPRRTLPTLDPLVINAVMELPLQTNTDAAHEVPRGDKEKLVTHSQVEENSLVRHRERTTLRAEVCRNITDRPGRVLRPKSGMHRSHSNDSGIGMHRGVPESINLEESVLRRKQAIVDKSPLLAHELPPCAVAPGQSLTTSFDDDPANEVPGRRQEKEKHCVCPPTKWCDAVLQASNGTWITKAAKMKNLEFHNQLHDVNQVLHPRSGQIVKGQVKCRAYSFAQIHGLSAANNQNSVVDTSLGWQEDGDDPRPLSDIRYCQDRCGGSLESYMEMDSSGWLLRSSECS